MAPAAQAAKWAPPCPVLDITIILGWHWQLIPWMGPVSSPLWTNGLGGQVLGFGIINGGAQLEWISCKRWAARVKKGKEAAAAPKLKSCASKKHEPEDGPQREASSMQSQQTQSGTRTFLLADLLTLLQPLKDWPNAPPDHHCHDKA